MKPLSMMQRRATMKTEGTSATSLLDDNTSMELSNNDSTGKVADMEVTNILIKMITEELAKSAPPGQKKRYRRPGMSRPEQPELTGNVSIPALAEVLKEYKGLTSKFGLEDVVQKVHHLQFEGDITENATHSSCPTASSVQATKSVTTTSRSWAEDWCSDLDDLLMLDQDVALETSENDETGCDRFGVNIEDFIKRMKKQDSKKKLLEDSPGDIDDDELEKQKISGDDDDSDVSELSCLVGLFSDYPTRRKSKGNTKSPRSSMMLKKKSCLTCTTKSNSTTCETKKSAKCNVHFSKVKVREYERSLSDNPACSGGPSIGLGWNYVDAETRTVDSFEVDCRKYTESNDLILSRAEREELLVEWGFSQKQIASMVREALKVKNNRRQTVQNLNKQRVEEAFESAARKIRNLIVVKR